ncbi:MAG: HNH endonuclease [Rhizobiaceae bacterium]|nr:HNH endonuclease [Rhizobiaceae bacterium]
MGKCMYCDDEICQFRQGYSSAQIDHILPVKKCPQLKWNIKNWIFCCSSCNGMKGDFDVLAENEDPMVQIENNRNELIKRVRSRLAAQINDRNSEYLAIRKIVQPTG